MATAVWDKRNGDDLAIYCAMSRSIASAGRGPLSSISTLLAGARNLSAQKLEFTRECISILARLGKVGTLRSYLGIGDAGKLIIPLRRNLSLRGQCWVAHDRVSGEGESGGLASTLERGAASLSELGAKFVRLDYNSLGAHSLDAIPENSVDLVTLLIGLHHTVPNQVPGFLAAIERVLSPGGVFLLREHDLDEKAALLPMLDCAHLVFNALTGVSEDSERQELRLFRSVNEWRLIVTGASGLLDMQCYEMQPRDPTLDIMMAFMKPGVKGAPSAEFDSDSALDLALPKTSPVALVLNQVPRMVHEGATAALEAVLDMLPKAQAWLRATSATMDSESPLKRAFLVLSEAYFEPTITMMQRFRPYAAGGSGDEWAPRAVDDVEDLVSQFFPFELLLLLPALRKRAGEGGTMEKAIVYILDSFAGAFSAPSQESSPLAAAAEIFSTQHSTVSTCEVEAFSEELQAAIPALRNPTKVLAESGLHPRVQAMLLAICKDHRQLCEALATRVDRLAWNAVKTEARRVVTEQSGTPTLPKLLLAGSPWNAVARAVLGCPLIPAPGGMNAFFLRSMGLGPLLLLQTEALAARGNLAQQSQVGGSLPQDLEAYVDLLFPVKSRVFGLDKASQDKGAESLQDIPGVLAVCSAVYKAKSATALGALLSGGKDTSEDKTGEVSGLLDRRTGVLQLLGYRIPTQIRLGGVTLEVRYRQRAAQMKRDTVRDLGKALLERNLVESARLGNGPNNYYKLPEWMQVEIIQLFGESMEHTP